MFLHLSVSHSVHGWVSGRHPWADTSLGRHLLGRYPPTPLGRHPLGKHPWADTPGETPPRQTPLWTDTPLGRHPQADTQADTPLPSACWDTHTHNLPSACWDTHPPLPSACCDTPHPSRRQLQRTVRILLECFPVNWYISLYCDGRHDYTHYGFMSTQHCTVGCTKWNIYGVLCLAWPDITGGHYFKSIVNSGSRGAEGAMTPRPCKN